MRIETDILIIGGGCAGLSLGIALAKLDTNGLQTIILERRTSYTRDRTWCFWKNPAVPDDFLVQHHWNKMCTSFNGQTVSLSCGDTPYQMLPSHIFYDEAQKVISSCSHIDLHLNANIQTLPEKIGKVWQIKTDLHTYCAKYVIDTRPPLLFNKDDALMWQSFLGIELETADDRFDPTQAQLMNFHSSQHMDVEFTYLLPITPRRALIEVTRFSTNSYQPELLEDALLCEITHHTNGSPYSVLHRENGILPMGLRHAQPVLSDITYIKVGLHAGAARMSTGYAFQRIQRWAKNCALNLSKGDVPCRHELDPFMRRAMDYIFLQVIRVNTAAAPHLFMALFRNVPTERVIRFLSDRERFADYFFIIKSLPTFTFLLGIQKLLTRYFIHFLKGR